MNTTYDTQGMIDRRALSNAEVEQVSGGLLFLLAGAALLLAGCGSLTSPCPPTEEKPATGKQPS